MKRIPSRLVASLLICASAAAQEAYTTRPVQNGPDVLVRFDVGTGVITDVGSTLVNVGTFRALTFDLEGTLFSYANTGAGGAIGLYGLDTTTGNATFLGGGGVVPGDTVTGLATEPVTGRLIGVGRAVGGFVRTYVLDPVNGHATVDEELPEPLDHIDTGGIWIDPTGRRFVAGYGSIFYNNAHFAQVYEAVGGALVPLPQGLGYVPNAGGQAIGYEPFGERVWIVGRVGWSLTSVFELDVTTGAATETISGLDHSPTDLAFPGFHAAEQGDAYCAAVPNSTGQVGLLAGFGSTSVAQDLFELRATGLPPSQFAMFLVAPERDFIPMPGGSQGNLCLRPAAGIGRYSVQPTDSAGDFSRQLELRALPTPSGDQAVLPGETWYFQAWHRDQNPNSTSNFSRGLKVTFD